MKNKIALVTIWTNNIHKMKKFYIEVLGFSVKLDLEQYVEFQNEGVRFAICEREVMHEFHDAFKEKPSGQNLELAFPCTDITDVNTTYKTLISKGAVPIKEPFDTPWGQKCALFADPDGNIHEIYCYL